MPKTFIIGDVHGCIDELKELVQLLAPDTDDQLIFIGDLIDRGPDSIGVVRQVVQWSKQLNIKLILGNHEEKFLRYVQHIKDGSGVEKQMKRIDEFPKLLNSLSVDELYFIEQAYHSLHIPEINTVLIHGGVWREIHFPLPASYVYNSEISKAHKHLSLLGKTRYVDPKGRFVSFGEEKPEDIFWAEEYKGEYGHIYFGHHPFIQSGPYHFAHATAIDTGCVFGGWLTAIEIAGQEVKHMSVAAREIYSKNLELK
jgi:bis(5'-nucleosyl)-tetraphosphatase (symmetrical)